jgi:hypothetical protein
MTQRRYVKNRLQEEADLIIAKLQRQRDDLYKILDKQPIPNFPTYQDLHVRILKKDLDTPLIQRHPLSHYHIPANLIRPNIDIITPPGTWERIKKQAENALKQHRKQIDLINKAFNDNKVALRTKLQTTFDALMLDTELTNFSELVKSLDSIKFTWPTI